MKQLINAISKNISQAACMHNDFVDAKSRQCWQAYMMGIIDLAWDLGLEVYLHHVDGIHSSDIDYYTISDGVQTKKHEI